MMTSHSLTLVVIGFCLLTWTPPGKADDTPSKSKKSESTFPGPTAEQQATTLKHLQMLMLATYNYANDHLHMPSDIVDKDNKPLLSWRVSLLPYLEHIDLYQRFKLNEPWDSEHNKPLLKEMPNVLQCQLDKQGQTKTYFQVFKGPRAFMEPGKKLRMPDFGDPPKARAEGVKNESETITDTLAQTFGIVEAGPAVPWTKPQDIAYHPNKPFPAIDGPYGFTMHVSYADGTSKAINTRVPEHLMRRMIERNDGKPIEKREWEMIQARPAPPAHLKDYYYNQSKDVEAKKPLPPVTRAEEKEMDAAKVEDKELEKEVSRVNPTAQEKPIVTKWEYKFVLLSVSGMQKDENLLNKYGNDGWEMVTASPRNQDGVPVLACIFKRPKR